MRGKLYLKCLKRARLGITPADAGKTRNKELSENRYKDHPRGCGENSLLMQGSCDDAGSPPRMRGKPD